MFQLINADIAIVGGGAAAVSMLKELGARPEFRGAVCTISVNQLGYSPAFTAPLSALTNTPVHANSLTHREPREFRDFLASRGWPYDLHDFVPRWLVARYIKETARNASRQFEGRYQHVSGHVTNLVRDRFTGWRVIGTHGQLRANAVVLAGGLGSARQLIPIPFRTRFVGASLCSGLELNSCAEASSRNSPTLVLGSKLSAVELGLALLDRGGSVCLASPSGVLPSVRTTLGQSTANPDVLTTSLRGAVDGPLRRAGFSLTQLESRAASDPLTLLDAEIDEASEKLNTWQNQIGTIIEAINAFQFIDQSHMNELMASICTFNSRFISAMPLETARKLQHASAEGRLTVKSLAELDESSTTYSRVLTAQGFDPPLVPQWINETHLSLSNEGIEPAYLSRDLEYRNVNGESTNVWALGTRTNTVVPIVNYLRTAVLQVPNIVDNLSSNVKRQFLGEHS